MQAKIKTITLFFMKNSVSAFPPWRLNSARKYCPASDKSLARNKTHPIITKKKGQGMYYQHRLFKFIGDTEFTTEIHMDSEKNNYNNMNVERK